MAQVGTCREAPQGSLTSCSKNLSSRVLSPGLLPAPSNSSLYSCRKTLQEDISKPQSPPSSAAFGSPMHQIDAPATTSGQQRTQRSQDSALCTHECWQQDDAEAALHPHRLKAMPRKAEKAFISSVSLSSQRFYPFSQMCSSQSHIITLSLQGGCIRYRPLHVQIGVFGPGPCAHKHCHRP